MLQPDSGLLLREKSGIVTLPVGTCGSQGAVGFFEKYASVMSLLFRFSCWVAAETEKALMCSSSQLTSVSHTHTHQCHGKTVSPTLTPVTNVWVYPHYFRTYLARCKSKGDELSAFLRTTLILHQQLMNSSMEETVTNALNTHFIAETPWLPHHCTHGYTSHQETSKK